jgi:hypothetical protein
MAYNSGLTQATITGNSSISLPSSTQVVSYTTIRITTSATIYQIATPDGTHDVYFLGCSYSKVGAASSAIYVYDAAAGSPPSLSANTAYAGAAGGLYFSYNATAGEFGYNSPQPIKTTSGIRVQAGGAGADVYMVVYYLTVTK